MPISIKNALDLLTGPEVPNARDLDMIATLLTDLEKRPRCAAMDAKLGEERKVLDHGFIRVVDYMGNDDAIVQAARTSYGKGTKTSSDDAGLIRYLMKRRHTTPFEMCELKLHIKLPIFVARQWIRHRTANVNEYSARYSILANEFYVPEMRDIQPQSKSNKQGRDGNLPEKVRRAMLETIRQHSEGSYQLYEELVTGWPWYDPSGTLWDLYQDPTERQHAESITGLQNYKEEFGMAREMARMVVPPNVYTEWYWKIDLHNLLHFLSLRADPHAQMEIRVYAEVICDIVKRWCPVAFQAFEDYVLGAVTFSRMEVEEIRELLTESVELGVPRIAGLSTREHREFEKKIGVPDDAYE